MMKSSESGSAQISALTSMRGIAALLVALFHVRYGFVNVSSINQQLFGFEILAKGYLWVDFFFMLSGYVLALRYGRDEFKSLKSYFKFVGVRLARIYPLHLVALVIFSAYVATQKGVSYIGENLESLSANFFLLHGWYGVFSENWNYPSWSLSSEWAAYLAFPVLGFAYKALRGRRILSLFVLAGLLLAFGIFVYRFHSGSLDIAYGSGWKRCLFSFSIGMMLFSLSKEIEFEKYSSTLDYAAFVLFAAVFCQLQFSAPDFSFVLTGAALLFCLGMSKGPFTKLLQAAPLVFLGEISFSIYMWHAIVTRIFGDLFARLGSPPWGMEASLFALGIVILAILGLSVISYRFIEKDLFLRIRKLIVEN